MCVRSKLEINRKHQGLGMMMAAGIRQLLDTQPARSIFS